MLKVVSGKGAMVWRLREWEGGDPARQAAAALQAGLDWVSIKIVDGTDTRWESESYHSDDQNDDLLPEAVAALREKGITVIGWGYEYGREPERVTGSVPSISGALAEAEKAVEVIQHYNMKHFQVDAQATWRAQQMRDVAEAYGQRLNRDAPLIEFSLCSYRFPLTQQPNFPVRTFAPFMDAFCPQVYFLEDNRPDAGAIQTKSSMDQYSGIADIPYFPIYPTYAWTSHDGSVWRADGDQISEAFQWCLEQGLPAAGIWDLPQASPAQLAALADFEWPESPEPPEPPESAIARLRDLASEMQSVIGGKTNAIEDDLDSYSAEILSLVDEIEGSK